MIELLAALTASSDLVEQQRCQISDLKDALQARVRARACTSPAHQAYTPFSGAGLTHSLPSGLHWCASDRPSVQSASLGCPPLHLTSLVCSLSQLVELLC